MRWRGRGRGCELLGSAATGGLLGGAISVVVNNALIEISLTPFFAAVFGGVLLLLGSLMGARASHSTNAHAPSGRLTSQFHQPTHVYRSLAQAVGGARAPAHPLRRTRILVPSARVGRCVLRAREGLVSVAPESHARPDRTRQSTLPLRPLCP